MWYHNEPNTSNVNADEDTSDPKAEMQAFEDLDTHFGQSNKAWSEDDED